MTKLNSSQLIAPSYAMQSDIVSTPPLSSTTYYSAFGFSAVTSTAETTGRQYVLAAGTIRRLVVWYRHAGTNGSTETSNLYFRFNNTTDTLIAANIVTATSANNALYTLDVNIPVVIGDFFTFKWVTPAWVTVPGQPYFNCIALLS